MWSFLISTTAVTVLTVSGDGSATLGEISEPSGHKNGKNTEHTCLKVRGAHGLEGEMTVETVLLSIASPVNTRASAGPLVLPRDSVKVGRDGGLRQPPWT